VKQYSRPNQPHDMRILQSKRREVKQTIY